MTNNEYKALREEHENASELFTFEHYNGLSWYPSRCMTSDDIKEMRNEYKNTVGYNLDGCNGRAMVTRGENGAAILKSYYTDVAAIIDGEFYKLWDGFSVTTLKHINIFRDRFGLAKMSKREWIELENVTETERGVIFDGLTGLVIKNAA